MGEFNVVFAFRIMQDKFASWATFQPLAGKQTEIQRLSQFVLLLCVVWLLRGGKQV
jgi:hypothetical protein